MGKLPLRLWVAGIRLLAGFENPWRGSACQMAASWV